MNNQEDNVHCTSARVSVGQIVKICQDFDQRILCTFRRLQYSFWCFRKMLEIKQSLRQSIDVVNDLTKCIMKVTEIKVD
jgi:hypothetical protein